MFRAFYLTANGVSSPPLPTPEDNITGTVMQLSANGAPNSRNFRDFFGRNLSAPSNLLYSNTQSKWKGSSIFFDGGTSIQIPLTSEIAFASGAFTWECWVYPTDIAFSGLVPITIMGNARSDNGGNFGLFINIQTNVSNQSFFTFRHWINGSTSATSSVPITINNWYHVAVTKDISNNLEIFVNGEKGTTGSTFSPTDFNFYIGSTYNPGGFANNFRGYLDDIRLTKGVIRYTTNFSPLAQEFALPTDPHQDNNVLLLDFEGVNNSALFHDYCGKSISAFGNAIISTTQRKFDSSSLYLDGNGDYLDLTASSDFDLFSGDSTIEFWIYFNALTGLTSHIIQFGTSQTNRNVIYINDNSLRFYTQTSLDNGDRIIHNGLAINTWYHIALVRSGSTATLYLNGTSVGSTNTTTYATGNLECTVGYQKYSGLSSDYLNAYVDNLRITKGVARYTSNFTPDNYPFILERDPHIDKVVALLHFNGVDGGVTFPELTNKNVTKNGTAQLSTTQSKFGGTSLFLNSGTLNIPSTTNEFLFTEDFTCEGWFYNTGNSGSVGSLFFYVAVGEGVGRLQLGLDTTNRLWIELFSVGQIARDPNLYPFNQWNHVAFTRQGTLFSIWLNGNQVASGNRSGTVGQNGSITIGGVATTNRYFGYADEIRITRGLARYTSNFTPRNRPFPEIN